MKEPYDIIADKQFPLPGDERTNVHLLVADVSALMNNAEQLEQATASLSPQRQSKATSCSNPRVRGLSVGVTLLLDRLLQERGLRERDMHYEEGSHGKPALTAALTDEGLPLQFNLSHSGRMAAAALLPGTTAVGLDIQHITRYRPEIVRRVFNAEDKRQLAACTDEASRERLFTRLWCRAEAYAKATGDGLQWPFPTPSPQAYFHDFEVCEDYLGCLCLLYE
ncbi:MAG: 4'-phosphopantetheinyl transferase superfamily protein [Bacteroidaceae bacterium]|nr:4'-phosphopantetheinyl transferase superfamily protein [Bacteroidaceae bacterium]